MDPYQQLVRAKVEDRLFGQKGRGTRLDRYVLLDSIGSGATGRVLAAYDTKLDRKVAIKLLNHGGGVPEYRSKDAVALAAEARALAKLAHPNVVGVFDVHDSDPLFVVMEFVDGMTLRRWLHGSPAWMTILDVLMGAGQGLAAAHAVGLVHRDVKPDNVLIDSQARARVVDFGLARAPAGPAADLEWTKTGSASSNVAATRSGRLAGTPAYMSPEQFEGEATALSDQYGFCAMAWEALFGDRPHAAPTIAGLYAAALTGPPAVPASGPGRPPPSVAKVLVRGLHPNPKARFTDMQALLDALRATRERRRIRWSVIVAGVAAFGAIGVWYADRQNAVEACAAEVQAAAPNWVNIQKTVSEAAWPATFVQRVAAAVEQRQSAWNRIRADSCRAARIDRVESTNVEARSADCLQERLEETKSFVRQVTTSPTDPRTALRALNKLTPVERCRDIPWVMSLPEPPDDHAEREQIRAVRSRIHNALVVWAIGRKDEARAIMQRARSEAMKIDFVPVHVKTTFLLGFMHDGKEQGDLHLEWAIQTALEHRLLDYVAAGWQQQALNHLRRNRVQQGLHLLDWSEAILRGLPSKRWRLASVIAYRAYMHHQQNDFARATQLHEEALQILGDDTGYATQVMEHYYYAGTAWFDWRQDEVAWAYIDRSQSMLPDFLRSGSWFEAEILLMKADIERRRGHGRAALALLERSRRSLDEYQSPEDITVGRMHALAALVLLEMDRRDEARDRIHKAESTKLLSAPPRKLAWLRAAQALICYRNGRADEAMKLLDDHLATIRSSQRGCRTDCWTLLATKASILRASGRELDLLQTLDTHVATLDDVYGPEHPAAAPLMNQRAAVLQQLGRTEAADQARRRAKMLTGNRAKYFGLSDVNRRLLEPTEAPSASD